MSRNTQPYTIIIPAYNEADVIGNVLTSLNDLPLLKEIIVVDDGSSDQTGSLAKKHGARVIRHLTNKGYGASLKTGILAAKTPYVVICDGDGQHRKVDLLKVVEKMISYDMVVGARGRKSHRPIIRRPGKWVLHLLVNFLSHKPVPDFNSGLRSFKVSEIKKYLHFMPDKWSFSTTSMIAMLRMNHPVKFVPIEVCPRQGRKSSVKIFSDGFETLRLIINLTVLFDPFSIFAPPAFCLMAASGIYFLIYSVTERVHITASMAIIFLSGLIIFFMGIICDQISSIRREMGREHFSGN